MSLQNLSLKQSYKTAQDDVLGDFFVPALSEAVSYSRASAYFTSGFLASITPGLYGLIKNNGRIRLVVSPNLSDEDIDAISKGYADKNSVIKHNLLQQLKDPENANEEKSLNILAGLIADGYLDIRVAFMEKDSKIGLFHDKMGIIADDYGNEIAFSGSMNATTNAVFKNYESIDVFCSWNYGERERVKEKKEEFEKIWDDTHSAVRSYHFPELGREIVRRYRRSKVDYDDVENWPTLPPKHKPVQVKENNYPVIPYDKGFKGFYEYQEQAINKWKEQNFRGIFDMATGTGKTLTALGALTALSDTLNHKLMVVIVAPYQHLVDQWVEDIRWFGMKPIIGYSSSPQSDWLQRLQNAVIAYNGDPDNFFVFVCTNATFKSAKVQEQLSKVENDLCLIVDEAHNIGAEGSVGVLSDSLYKYRLALSATLDRHHDEIGTAALYNFFGQKCIEYPIEQAIKDGFLTPYYYYPIITYLDAVELEEYDKLTKAISKCWVKQGGETVLNELGKTLLIKRARVVAAAKSKISALKDIIVEKNLQKEKHMLVYCGAASLITEEEPDDNGKKEDERQITNVIRMLGTDLHMVVGRFTSEESVEQRREITEHFKNGDFQALVAIKCLDEGVNIPSIETAFILASTTNPKEYIQRRGRVLRISKDTGKKYAKIYDFITLPTKLHQVAGLAQSTFDSEVTLVKNELKRANEFARIAENYAEALEQIDQIKQQYRI